MKRIAVLTSGGDAPGMNAALRATVRLAISRGADVLGVRRGYLGLIHGDMSPLDSNAVGGIIEAGGTILRSGRCREFFTEAAQAAASTTLRRADIEGLVVIGGGGSQTGALALHRRGVPVVGVPSTIDNDLPGTDWTIGADTALNTIVEAIDRIRDTASAHERTFVVETMGRACGWLALNAALATGADIVLIPEVPWNLDEVAARIRERQRAQKAHTIIVLAEGAGAAVPIAHALGEMAGTEVRVTVLGYLQRGGAPSALDRILASRLAAAATQTLLAGTSGVIAAWRGGEIMTVPMEEAVAGRRALDLSLYRLEGVFAI